MTFNHPSYACLPAICFIGDPPRRGQSRDPAVVGRRLTINPLMILLA